jgi:hypothetical protein
MFMLYRLFRCFRICVKPSLYLLVLCVELISIHSLVRFQKGTCRCEVVQLFVARVLDACMVVRGTSPFRFRC